MFKTSFLVTCKPIVGPKWDFRHVSRVSQIWAPRRDRSPPKAHHPCNSSGALLFCCFSAAFLIPISLLTRKNRGLVTKSVFKFGNFLKGGKHKTELESDDQGTTFGDPRGAKSLLTASKKQPRHDRHNGGKSMKIGLLRPVVCYLCVVQF